MENLVHLACADERMYRKQETMKPQKHKTLTSNYVMGQKTWPSKMEAGASFTVKGPADVHLSNPRTDRCALRLRIVASPSRVISLCQNTISAWT